MGTNNRKAIYEKRRNELKSHCQNCKMCSPERCNNCIWGKRLRWLQTEFSDITGWSHQIWHKGI